MLKGAYGNVIVIHGPYRYKKITNNAITFIDKLGPVALECTKCRSERDFVMHGLSSFFSFYFGTSVFLVIFTLIGKADFGRYWRYVALVLMGCVELMLMFDAADPIRYVFHWRTPHEKVAILHQIFIAVSIAFSQIGPILWPDDSRNAPNMLSELENITNVNLNEASLQFASAFEPVAKDPVAVGHLQRKMEKMVVELQLADSDPGIRERKKRR
jgi:hypothetical protein